MSKYGFKQKRNHNGGKYYWELQDWVNQLFITYDKCAICDSKFNLEPHHIIQVKPYDKLYSNVKNGLVMCKSCHRKYHEEYGNNINPYTLLMFMKSHVKGAGGLNNKQLNKKLKQSNKLLKQYQEETFKLREELNELKKKGVENESK